MDWFGDGLRFGCTGCGNCCKGPGYVWVNDSEILAMAGAVGLSREEFEGRYVRWARGRRTLVGVGADERCAMLGDDDRCSVYDVRPKQCRRFPFWPGPVRNQEEWCSLRENCPGIDEGKLYSKDEIREILANRRST